MWKKSTVLWYHLYESVFIPLSSGRRKERSGRNYLGKGGLENPCSLRGCVKKLW